MLALVGSLHGWLCGYAFCCVVLLPYRLGHLLCEWVGSAVHVLRESMEQMLSCPGHCCCSLCDCDMGCGSVWHNVRICSHTLQVTAMLAWWYAATRQGSNAVCPALQQGVWAVTAADQQQVVAAQPSAWFHTKHTTQPACAAASSNLQSAPAQACLALARLATGTAACSVTVVLS